MQLHAEIKFLVLEHLHLEIDWPDISKLSSKAWPNDAKHLTYLLMNHKALSKK